MGGGGRYVHTCINSFSKLELYWRAEHTFCAKMLKVVLVTQQIHYSCRIGNQVLNAYIIIPYSREIGQELNLVVCV